MVDTTMWTEGVVYRTHTSDFRTYLVAEVGNQGLKRKEILDDLDKHRQSVLECSINFEKTKCEGDKLTIALKIFKKTYDNATKYSVMELMRQSLQQQEEAEAAARDKKRREEEASSLSSVGLLADKARLKDYAHRSSEERRFMALDMLLRR